MLKPDKQYIMKCVRMTVPRSALDMFPPSKNKKWKMLLLPESAQIFGLFYSLQRVNFLSMAD